jgi:hypothetical protein
MDNATAMDTTSRSSVVVMTGATVRLKALTKVFQGSSGKVTGYLSGAGGQLRP